jgi:hypothetical protein
VVVETDYTATLPAMTIKVKARRSDAKYETRELVFEPGQYLPIDLPTEDNPLRLVFFPISKGQSAQIQKVWINGAEVHASFVLYEPIAGMEGFQARYDDSVLKYRLPILGNAVLDFQVLTSYDPKTLMVVDNSDWGALIDSTATVEVTPPGFSEPATLYWAKKQINAFNSHVLGISCVKDCQPQFIDLPDGVYHIALNAADGSRKVKAFLKTDLLRLRIDRLRIGINVACDGTDRQKKGIVNKADLYLTTAESHLRLGNFIKSHELYLMADNLTKGCGV